jgi:hypothetical protein
LFILLALILTSAGVPPEAAFDLYLAKFISGQRFDWVGWETQAISSEIAWWLRGSRTHEGQHGASKLFEGKEEVLAFLDRQRQIADLERSVRAELAQLPQSGSASSFEQSPILPPSVEPLERELDALRLEREEAAPRIERIMAGQVGQLLMEEGMGYPSPGAAGLLPPVTFRFNDLPTYLIISPRNEIRSYRGVYLLPDVPDVDRARLEAAIEARLDVSALIVDVGGVGSWPTMVIDNASLRSLFDIIAHEWTHTYLFFRPLGAHYADSRDLTTMNETVASIVGSEVAGLVMNRYYPDLPPAPAAARPARSDNSGREDFNQAMRRIRLRVDELLAEGRVVEAESFMEAERQKLVEAGYHLRRLNQAYFAFHGSYATSPASVDPIGPWIRQLRAQSGSLEEFLARASELRGLDELLLAIGESRP